jgi:hypothetical protein
MVRRLAIRLVVGLAPVAVVLAWPVGARADLLLVFTRGHAEVGQRVTAVSGDRRGPQSLPPVHGIRMYLVPMGHAKSPARQTSTGLPTDPTWLPLGRMRHTHTGVFRISFLVPKVAPRGWTQRATRRSTMSCARGGDVGSTTSMSAGQSMPTCMPAIFSDHVPAGRSRARTCRPRGIERADVARRRGGDLVPEHPRPATICAADSAQGRNALGRFSVLERSRSTIARARALAPVRGRTRASGGAGRGREGA